MKRILVVVDVQNDFVSGALGTPEAEAILPAVVEKIRSYPQGQVIATRDTHTADYLSTQEGRLLPVEHCIEGTPGWEIVPQVARALKGAKVVDKPTFGSVALAELLLQRNEEEPLEVELVGLCTDICVVSNALLLKAFLPEVPITVDSRCCAGVTPERHRAALDTLRSCQVTVL